MTMLNPNVKDELNKKNIFLIMVGLAGSGKSTAVKDIKTKIEARDSYLGIDRKTYVLSSDAIKDELFGEDRVYDKSKNVEVFALLHKRIKDLCTNNNIIIDATNLTIKTRASLINCTKKNKNNIYYVAYVMTTPIAQTKIQNEQREGVAKVPDEVITKHAKAFEVPIYEEGYDKIIFHNYPEEKIKTFDVGWNLRTDMFFNHMKGFNQKNPHHLYTLDEHTMKVVYGISNWGCKEKTVIPQYLMRAAILHDIGKCFVGEPKALEDGTVDYNHYRYKGHANYGAYLLLSNMYKLGFNNFDDILNCIAIVNYHMEPFAWRVVQPDGRRIVLAKTIEKMKKRYGKYYDLIVFFNIFDKKATGTEDGTGDEYEKVKKKKPKVKPQGLTKKQKKQLKKQRKKEEKRLRREKKKQKELARQEYLARKKAETENGNK